MRNLILGATLSGLLIAAALLSFVWTPYDVTLIDVAAKLQPPSAAHWFGTDHFGRDTFSMVMVGARVSLAVALAAVGIGAGLGAPLGLLAAALHGSWLDEAVMRTRSKPASSSASPGRRAALIVAASGAGPGGSGSRAGPPDSAADSRGSSRRITAADSGRWFG